MPPSPKPRGLIDAHDLAGFLDVSVQAVYRMSASGRIPKYKLGHRTVRFKLDEVLDALREEAAPATADACVTRDSIDDVLDSIRLEALR